MSSQEKKQKTIEARKAELKQKILEALCEYPSAARAYRESGVSRPTYYRWLKDDPDFFQAAEKAKRRSIMVVNDMARQVLVKKIQEGNSDLAWKWLNKYDEIGKTEWRWKMNIEDSAHEKAEKLRVLYARGLEFEDEKEKFMEILKEGSLEEVMSFLEELKERLRKIK